MCHKAVSSGNVLEVIKKAVQFLLFWGALADVGCRSCSPCVHPSLRHCLPGALSLGPTAVSGFPPREPRGPPAQGHISPFL